eukprot:6454310-Prymnesium_polylepis.1
MAVQKKRYVLLRPVPQKPPCAADGGLWGRMNTRSRQSIASAPLPRMLITSIRPKEAKVETKRKSK